MNSDHPHELAHPTHVVGVGASAGGLEALERLFRAMPADTGMAFVVIQHLSPDFKSLMGELLERFTSMPAIPVTDSAQIRPDTIYLLPPRKELTIEDDLLISRDREKDGTLSMPINLFFRSLAASWGERAIAVVLSGTGTDGSAGILDVRDAGGLVLVETPDSARFDGMPQSAIKTGCVDAILPPEDMPKALRAFAEDPATRHQPPLDGEDADTDQAGLPAILRLLNRRYKIDFNDYKPATIMRRIGRRVAAMESGGDDIELYSERLASDPEELDTLYKDLLIGVTRFFRDPEAFQVLRDAVVPQIIAQAGSNEEIRIWVCGCSTGEEAYSIAILFLDAFASSGREPRIKVLATDLHEDSLTAASEGVYDEDKFADMPKELLATYFEPQGERHYKVIPSLRRCLIFSVQNVLKDPPFTRMHMVSCRNLLIYLQPPAQTRAIAALYYALRVDGTLFLGTSETLGDLSNELETIDRYFKLYRKIKAGTPLLHLHTLPALPDPRIRLTPPLAGPMPRLYDSLLDRYVPGGILVNERREILHIFGDASRFIQASKGRFSGDVLNLVSHPISLALGTALRSAGKQRHTVVLKGIREQEQSPLGDRLTISVDPFPDRTINEQFFLIRIEPEPSAPTTAESITEPDQLQFDHESAHHVRELEGELEKMRESLQTTVEELETTNEELQASNEELLASNEELQSTNEELHSVNEELYSVNAEHELKIEELNRTASDLRNLMQSTDTATIFLDADGKLRLYTPRALEIFNLMPQDVGRELRHFQPLLADPTLFDDIDQVLQGQGPLERTIACGSDCSYIRRCMVYQNTLGKQQGVVINYLDTSQISRANRALHDTQAWLQGFMDHNPAIAWIKDDQGRIIYINKAYEERFGVSLTDRLGKTDADIWTGDLMQTLREVDREMLEHNTPREIEFALPEPDGDVSYWRNFKFIIQGADGQRYIGGIALDVTERKQHLAEIASKNRRLETALAQEQTLRAERGHAEEALRLSESRLRQVVETLPQLVWTCTAEGACDFLSPQWVRYTGKDEAEQLGYGWLEQLHPDDRQRTLDHWMATAAQGQNLEIEFRIRRHDGVYRWFRTQAVPLRDEAGRVVKWFGSNTDIDDIRRVQQQIEQLNADLEQRVAQRTAELEREKQALEQSEAALQEAKTLAETANQAKSRFLATMSHEIRTPLNAIIGMSYMLNQSRLDETQQQQLTTIESASRNLLMQINDILDLAKIEADEVVIERISFTLPALFRDLASLFAPQARTKGLTLVLPEDFAQYPKFLEGDRYKIQQILTNLIGNALKFTAHGQIRVDLETVAHDQERITLRFSVSDTGIGIDPEVIPRLFLPFSQADASTTRLHGGTGLGLSLVRQLTEHLGGHVGVVSHPNRGSTFWTEIPLLGILSESGPGAHDQTPETTAFDADSCWLPGVRVLVVDDSRMNLEVCQHLLVHQGAQATLCASGACAIQQIEISPTGFDLVLMDIQMPDMDGYETTRRLRALTPGRPLPIVALTAGVLASERERALAAGMDGFLSKPIDPGQLVRVLRNQIESRRGQPLPVHSRAAAAEETHGWPLIEGIDAQTAARLLGGDLAFFRELLAGFLTDNADVVAEIGQGVETGNQAAAARRVHKLRGQAGSLGAESLREAAGALENALTTGSPNLQDCLAAFASAHAELSAAASHWLRD